MKEPWITTSWKTLKYKVFRESWITMTLKLKESWIARSWKNLEGQGLERVLYYKVLKVPCITMSWKNLELQCLESTLYYNVLKEPWITRSWKSLVLQCLESTLYYKVVLNYFIALLSNSSNILLALLHQFIFYCFFLHSSLQLA